MTARRPIVRVRARSLAIPLLLLSGIGSALVLGRTGRQFVRRPPEELARVTNPHAHEGAPACEVCHADSHGELVAPQSELCARCHHFGHGNHPVSVVQRTPPRVSLPLGKGNVVTCHTCHDVHDVGREQAGLRLPFNQLCESCHPGH